MSLIRMGALGSKRGIGIDPATLSPTGHWIGGVGITLNTTPDPDQISAWADQSGLSPARNFGTVVESQQPVAHLFSVTEYAPRFGAAYRRLVSSALTALITANNWTLIACGSTSAAVGGGTSTNPSGRPTVLGGENAEMGLLAYTISGARYMTTYIRDSGSVQYAPANVAIPTGEPVVLIGRLAGGATLTARAIHAGGDTSNTAAAAPVGSLTGGLRCGQGHGNSATAQWQGDLYHAVAFNVALTDDQIADVAAFLLHRYASAT